MAADPFSILKSIIDLGVKVMKTVDTVRSNREECRRICTLVGTVRTVVKGLQRTPKAMADKGMTESLKGLKQALERSLKLVLACLDKNIVRSGIEASDVAAKLRQVYQHITTNLLLVNFANGVCNNSTLADIKKIVADLRANNDYASKWAKILKIVDAHPDVHLKREVKILVDTYHNSTKYASDQNRKERETKKIVVASRPKVKNVKDNVPVDSKAPCASLSYGSTKSTSMKSVIGQGGPSIVNKDSSHSSNLTNRTGSSKNKRDNIKKIDEPNTTKLKIGKTSVPAGSEGSRASLPGASAKSTSVKGQDGRNILNKIIRSIKNMTRVTSIDVHPTKPWIVTGHEGGIVSIWDYRKKQTVMEMQVTKVPGNFANIRHKLGDGAGYIRVYPYTDTMLGKAKIFRADHHESVDSLAVHKTKTYLLSSSAYGRKINLWDWSRDWVQIHEFDVRPTYPDGVLSLKFNPRDTNTFACLTDDERVQVGNIKSFSLTTKLEGQQFKAADYFVTRSRQQLMVTLRFTSPDAEIWDLETGEVVHTLGVSGHETRHVAGHPTLPILVTALDDGTLCFWDANTYRLGKKVHITDSPALHMALFTDINDITRLVVTFKSMIAIMEVNLPRANTSGQTSGG